MRATCGACPTTAASWLDLSQAEDGPRHLAENPTPSLHSGPGGLLLRTQKVPQLCGHPPLLGLPGVPGWCRTERESTYGKAREPRPALREKGQVSAGGGVRGGSALAGGWVSVAGVVGVGGAEGCRVAHGRGLRFPPGQHTYLGSRHAGQHSLSARRRNTEPRKEGRDVRMTKVHSSYGSHRTARKHRQEKLPSIVLQALASRSLGSEGKPPAGSLPRTGEPSGDPGARGQSPTSILGLGLEQSSQRWQARGQGPRWGGPARPGGRGLVPSRFSAPELPFLSGHTAPYFSPLR